MVRDKSKKQKSIQKCHDASRACISRRSLRCVMSYRHIIVPHTAKDISPLENCVDDRSPLASMRTDEKGQMLIDFDGNVTKKFEGPFPSNVNWCAEL